MIRSSEVVELQKRVQDLEAQVRALLEFKRDAIETIFRRTRPYVREFAHRPAPPRRVA
jgi:hypothetical protein